MILSPGRPWLCCVKGLQLSQAPDAEGQNRYFPTHAKACYCYDTYRKLKSFMKNTKCKYNYFFFFKSNFFFLQNAATLHFRFTELERKYLKSSPDWRTTLYLSCGAPSSHVSMVGSAFSRALLLQTVRL